MCNYVLYGFGILTFPPLFSDVWLEVINLSPDINKRRLKVDTRKNFDTFMYAGLVGFSVFVFWWIQSSVMNLASAIIYHIVFCASMVGMYSMIIHTRFNGRYGISQTYWLSVVQLVAPQIMSILIAGKQVSPHPVMHLVLAGVLTGTVWLASQRWEFVRASDQQVPD